MRFFLKILAWITIVGGFLAHPIIYGMMISHHLRSESLKYEGYLVPSEYYLMIFGMIGSVVTGAILLLLLDIQQRLKDGMASFNGELSPFTTSKLKEIQ